MLTLEDAYEATRHGRVVLPRPGFGLVRLTGAQRIWFLQNTVTNDFDDPAEGTWIKSCFLNPKGKVIAVFRAGILPDEVLLDIEPGGTEPLFEWFTKYKFRTKVEIEEIKASSVTIIGPDASPNGPIGRESSTSAGTVSANGPTVVFGDVNTTDVYAGTESPNSPEELSDVVRVEASVARFGVDFDSNNLPQEGGLTSIVSVTKGCYVGQEVMARIHFRGHINKCVRKITLAEPRVTGTELFQDGAFAGRVTTSVVSPSEGPIAIAMLSTTVAPGAVLDDGSVAGPIPSGTKIQSTRPTT